MKARSHRQSKDYAFSQRHSCHLEKGKLQFDGDGVYDHPPLEKVSKACATSICEMLDAAYIQGSKDRSQKIREAMEIEGEDALE